MKRRDGLLVGLGTAGLLVSALGAGLVLGLHHVKPQAARPPANASPSAVALASPSLLPSPLASLLPSPLASLLPSPGVPSPPPRTPAPTRRPTPPPPPPFSGSWPDYRSGPEQSGWNGAENQLDASAARRLAQRWSFGGGGVSPVIAGGDLYVAGAAEVDVMPAAGCGQASCGASWRADLGMSPQGPGTPGGAPAVADGGLFVTVNVPAGTGWLYAFHAAGCGSSTCAPMWKQQIGFNTSSGPGTNGYVSSAPVASGGLVYAAPTNPGTLYAFADGSGALAWKATLQAGLGTSSPAVAGGVLYVLDGDALTAYTASGCGAATCSPLWAVHVGSAVGSTPAVSGGRVLVDDAGGTVHAYDAKNGAALWTASTGVAQQHGSVLAAPNVVVAAGSNSMVVLDPASGAVLWTIPVGASVASASPTGGDGVGYVLANDDRLFAFTTTPCGASTCAPIWSASVGASNGGGSGYDGPVVAGGRLFVHAADGPMVSLSPS